MAEVQQQQELRGVLQAAQAALEEGRPQEAIAACRHVLQHYPDSITALRLLGEACLEAWTRAEHLLGGQADHTAAVQYWERLAGSEIRGA